MSILDWIDLLSDLSLDEKNNLEMFCQEKFVKAWEVIFKEEDYATAMYILKKGNVEITRKTNDWWKVILWEVKAEGLLWEMAIFWEVKAEEWLWEMAIVWDRNKRMATATALSDCTLIVILSFSINEIIKKHPKLYKKIQFIINDRTISNKNKIN